MSDGSKRISVGDNVVINSPRSKFHGFRGLVQELHPDEIHVLLDSLPPESNIIPFFSDEVKKE
jgi:hypothetical protein